MYQAADTYDGVGLVLIIEVKDDNKIASMFDY
jgi:hypothetical protein